MFIAFEGPDGSGKSTVARRVSERLAATGLDVTLTREPGGTMLGQGIRQLLLERNLTRRPVTELLMMCADRAEHVRTVIVPALERGQCVITDRYAGSTRAYQGAGLGVEADVVEQAIRIATGGLEPHLSVLFDIDPETARMRLAGRPDGQNDIDRRSVEFHERVREGFLSQAHARGDSWVVIDASLPLDDVVAKTLVAVHDALANRVRA